jgi:DNA sulfur modification protein DndC
LEDGRPWLVALSGGKDRTMLTSLVSEAVSSLRADQRKNPVSVVCTDARVEIPAIARNADAACAARFRFALKSGM